MSRPMLKVTVQITVQQWDEIRDKPLSPAVDTTSETFTATGEVPRFIAVDQALDMMSERHEWNDLKWKQAFHVEINDAKASV